MASSTVHKVLRNRIYCGEFVWSGRIYRGIHTPLVARESWEAAQQTLDRRLARRRKRSKHNFPFAGLVSCGHCGCSLVGEIKKGAYIYYRCTGYKGRCPERYARQELLETEFSRVLRSIVIDKEVIVWVAEALRQSHADERRFHDEAIARLKTEHERAQNRLDAMYEDRLDGRIDVAHFDRKAREWRASQDRLLRSIEEHQSANRSYMDEGIKLLELARRAPDLFDQQPPVEKRRLLDFVLSNCSWKNGKLTAAFRQPFDMLALANEKNAGGSDAPTVKSAAREDWLPMMDAFRTVSLQMQGLAAQ